MDFDGIIVIANPKSRHQGYEQALKLMRRINRLTRHGPDAEPKLFETASRGHAEDIAYDEVLNYKRPLVISVSGDGGYHEVPNGLVRAGAEYPELEVTTAVFKAGNGNDHWRSWYWGKSSFVAAIGRGNTGPLDLLRIEITTSEYSWSRYVHSYIGFGLTADAAAMLNEQELNGLTELKVVPTSLLHLHPLLFVIDGQERRLSSLSLHNVSAMAKHLTMSAASQPDDGLFEVAALPYRRFPRLRLAGSALKAAAAGLRGWPQVDRFVCHWPDGGLVQMDGEVKTVPPDSLITVACEPGLLNTLQP